MWIRWLLASLHLIALGIGLAAVWTRGRALRGSLDRDSLQRCLSGRHLLGRGGRVLDCDGFAARLRWL